MKNSNLVSFFIIQVTRIDIGLKLSGKEMQELGRVPRHDANIHNLWFV